MSAIFRIGQAGVFGAFGRARGDLLPFSVAGATTFEAQDLTHISYLWEVISAPVDGIAPILAPAGAICTSRIEERGGYLIRLTVDAGLTTEDVNVLYVGLPLATSGLPIPAAFETNQDNSITPYDGSQGWWFKQERFNKWVDANLGGGFVSTKVYTDEINGSDVSGDGSAGKPYKTFVYACAQQALPLTLSDWATPLEFHLAPGTYVSGVLPQRLHMKIIGDNCTMTGDLEWGIDPQLWDTFGAALTNAPILHIARCESTLGREMDTPIFGYNQGFRLAGGNLIARNSNSTGTYLMPTFHLLTLTGVYRDTFNIYNEPAGTGAVIDATGPMKLVLRDSKVSTGGVSRICGEVDRDVGLGVLSVNAVYVYAEKSDVRMQGVCRVERLEDCQYSADYTVNLLDAPYAYGLISGDNTIPSAGHVRNSVMTAASFFGCTVGSPAPAHTGADAVVFDRPSLLGMAEVCNPALSFIGFYSTAAGAFTRGWFFTEDDLTSFMTVNIPLAGNTSAEAGLLFEHAYAAAAYWKPNGAAMNTMNRLIMRVEPGFYTLSQNLNLSSDYVNVYGIPQGLSYSVDDTVPPDIALRSFPGVFIYANSFVVSLVCTTAVFDSLAFMQSAAGGTEKFCVEQANGTTAPSVVFSNIMYVQYPSAGKVRAFRLATDGTVLRATFENNMTLQDGFLWGGCFDGITKRCAAKNYSFGAVDAATTALPYYATQSFLGVAEDCIAYNYSFGAINGDVVGGSAVCTAKMRDCTARDYSFGAVRGVSEAMTASNLNSYLTRCIAGGCSFGYSNTGAALFSSTATDCSADEYSFGCSEEAASYGEFLAVAHRCTAAQNSFGSNVTDPTLAHFSGTVVACEAGVYSFGANGEIWDFTRMSGCRAGGGSFGDQPAKGDQRTALFERCTMTGITAATGGIGVYGAVLRECVLIVDPGEDVAPVMLNGGSGNTATRLYGCDLYASTVHTTCVDSSVGAVDVQMAHCRSNVDISADVINLLIDPCNTIDVNYNPTTV